MRKALRAVLLVVIVAAAGQSAGAPNDFYLNLLRRGVAQVQAGNYDAGVNALRIAAFGLIDYIPQFQTAQIHIALASDRLGREADARHALQRVLAAERIERAYAQLALTPAVRAEFDRVAGRLLTGEQRAVLYGGPEQPGAPPQVATATPVPMAPPPVPIAPTVAPQPVPPPAPVPVPVPAPQPVVPKAEPRIPAPEPRTTMPEPRIPAPEPRTTTPVPPTTMPEPRIPTPEPQTTTPEPRITTPEPRTTTPAPRTTIPEPRTTVPVPRASRPAPAPPPSDRAAALRLAEEAYLSRDYRAAVSAFERIGKLRAGEERLRYQFAVALYEMGRYADAKRELAAALPHLELTRDVERYRAKIEGAIVP